MTEHPSRGRWQGAPPAFTRLTNLASARVGARAVAASDEFFAPRSNLLQPEPPLFLPGKYTSRGKWMDGWESRRRRTPGHDWCVIALATRGIVRGVDVDTRYFTGNFPPHCSIDAIDARGALPARLHDVAGPPWTPLLPKSALGGDTQNFLSITDDRAWTHLRLNIFPDGGVARLRVYGEVVADWKRLARNGAVDLAALRHGGLVIETSDSHYGSPNNMLMPGRATSMADGWETRRRRGPGHDWAVIRLGAAGIVSKVEIDTNHFKGNYPDSASLDGLLPDGTWTPLLAQTRLRPHSRHLFTKQIRAAGAVSMVRLNIYPDGGVSRLRVYGRVALD